MPLPRQPKGDKPFKEAVYIQLPEPLMKRMRNYSGKSGLPLAKSFEEAIEEYLNRKEQNGKDL